MILHVLIAMVAGWLQRHQQQVITSLLFVRSMKEEALEQMVMLGERVLSYAIHQYLAHCHTERNHQGLANQLIIPEPALRSHSGQVVRRERLGGLLSYYYREAA